MKIKLKYHFKNNPSHDSNVKHFSDLSLEKKKLFIDFLIQIYNDEPLDGKNKSSAQLPPIINHLNMKNYAIFMNNDFFHYHLGKDFSLNPSLTYKYYGSSLLLEPRKIQDLNNIYGKFKTCDNLVNYQKIDDEIIIYNITKHSSWSDLINNLIFQNIPFDYTTCQYCNSLINLKQNCACFNPPYNTTAGVGSGIRFYEEVTLIFTRSNQAIEELTIESLEPFILY